MIWGDYHIHTTYSGCNGHATNTPELILQKAKGVGLKQVGICDHGLNHIFYATTPNRLKKLKKSIELLNSQQRDVRLLMGIEANIFSAEGEIDLQNVDRGMFDLVVAGFHKMVWTKKLKDGFELGFPQWLANNEQVKRKFTAIVVATLKTQKIDILAHPGYGLPVDIAEVAKVAADYGVKIELNGKRINLSDEELYVLAESKAQIVANSDAHDVDRIGDVSLPLATLKKLGIEPKRLANYERVLFEE